MPTRNANEYLASGEADDFKKGGVTDEDTLKDKAEIDALISTAIAPIDARVTDIENGHVVLLNAKSTLASQEPTGLDTPLQLTFGDAQGNPLTDDITIDVNGAIKFHVAEKFIMNFRAHYGRTGATGTSHLMFRFKKNGVQVGDSFATKLDSANVLIPWDSSSFIIDAQVDDVITAEIIRDSTGADFGGVFQFLSSNGWNSAPCCAVSVYKV